MASTSTSSNCDKWYFTKEQLENTPSRKCGFDAYKELQYRQQAANFIQDMGQRLQVSQLCINTAIVYMHRFYVFHSFTNFPWHQMAAAALFLAAKVEEQPRKLEYVIRVANICKNPRDRNFDINSERYAAQSQDLVFNENVLLQTLGFDVAIDHPHTYVVRCCHLVRASKDLAQTSYFMASNSLHLTTMCVQYKPTVVACFCILLACKWANWEIPLSNEKKEWYTYVDPTVTAELLQQLTSEFLVIFENCPSRLKEKIAAKQESSSGSYEQEKRDSNSSRSLEYKGEDHHKNRSSRPPEAASSSHRSQEQREREYKERKEKERIAHMSGITLTNQSHHHRPPGDLNKLKSHSRPQSSGVAPYPPPGANRSELKDLLKEVREAPFVSLASREPNRGDLVKDNNYGAARGEKEVAKRDSFAKSNIQTDLNSLTNYSDARQQRVDPNRAKTADHSKTAVKQEMMTRRYEEQKISHIKTETDNIKKHLSSSSDKSNSNAYHKSTLISTSHKLKSPFNLDSKSVPKMMNQQPNAITQKSQFNGNNASGSYDKPPVFHETDAKIKTEIHPVKNEIPIPVVIKRPSLFSPDQTPQPVVKSEPLDKIPHSNLTVLSPISSPPLKNSKYSNSYDSKKKIDQVEGFENLMRENTIGMAAHVHNNDSKSTIVVKDEKIDIKNECHKESGSQSSLINGLDTNVNLISSLLKEAVSTSHLSSVVPTIKQETVETNTLVVLPASNTEKEHRHHKSKKKKEKHKHKDKSKEDKEKKRKHKEKDRDKHKNKEKRDTESDLVSQPISEPIKIKIQKDKIQPLNELKIKIPKDKIKTEGIVDSMVMPQKSSGGLKIKIPKDIIANCNPGGSNMHQLDMSATGMNHSRKRDRSSSSDAPTPCKISKMSHRESKQNGRHSFSKVREKLLNSSVSSVGSRFISNANSSSSSVSRGMTFHELEENNNSKTTSMQGQLPKYDFPSSNGLLSPIPSNDFSFTKPPVLLSPLSSSSSKVVEMEIPKQSQNPSFSTHSSSPKQQSVFPPSGSYAPSNSYSHSNFYDNRFTKPPRQDGFQQIPRNVKVPQQYPNMQQQSMVGMPMDNMFNQNDKNPYAYSHFLHQYHQMVPPQMSNIAPPNYDMYSGYYGNYMMPDLYQQQLNSFDVVQPPLPVDAPPVNDVPPPPPPPE